MKTNQPKLLEAFKTTPRLKRCRLLKSILKPVFLLFVFSFIFSLKSEATHFRYGNITWSIVSGRTVTFHISEGWRRSAFSNPNVGNTVVGADFINFGDGSGAQVNLVVTTVNVAEDWFYGEATITYTYPGTLTNFVAFVASCCRISTLQQGNNDRSYNVEAHVVLGNGDNSPVSSMPPIVNVGVNGTPATFILAASDPDGDILQYRLSNPTEMGEAALTNPIGLTIHPSTGLVSWNTTGLPLGGLYMVQFTVDDGRGGTIAVDMILRIIQQSNPPHFDYTVTPVNGNSYEIQPGQTLCFNVKALDNDPGDNVLLSAIGLPVGSTTLPVLPTSGNPVQTTFCWTPTNAQLGARVVNFVAQDNNGTQVNSSVSIIVSLDPVFDVPPTPVLGSLTCLVPGQPYQTQIQATSPDPLLNVQITSATIASNATLNPGLPTLAGNTTSTTLDWTPTSANWGPQTFSFTATDNLSHTTNHSFDFIVNAPPTFTSSQSNTYVNVGQLFSYSIVISDPDIGFGDIVDIIGLGLPSWLTLVPTGTTTATLSGTPTLTDVGIHSINLEAQDIYHHCNSPVKQYFDIVVCDLAVSATAGTIACYGGKTCVTVTATGGTSPYSGTGELCDYGMGNYTFDVTDGRGCTVTSDPVDITEPAKLNVTATSTPSSGSDGTATANPSGGTIPYDYLWTPSLQTSQTATGLAAGIYTVVVTDANSCNTSTIVEVEPSCNLNPPGPINGPDAVCKKQTGIVYCATPNPLATSYNWILPNGISVVGSSNGPCITVKISTKFKGGFICAQAVTPCGTTLSACKNVISIHKDPVTPGSITGPSSLCPNEVATYSIVPIPYVTSYLWSEDHLTILSGQGSNTVVVKADANFNYGKIKVKAINCKGKSGNRYKNIARTPGCRISAENATKPIGYIAESISDFTMYPNPTTGKATISFNADRNTKYDLKIFDMIGLQVLNENLTMSEGINTREINLEKFSKGIYLISIQAENGMTQVQNLIVE